jgi:hypothetical protein
MREVENCSVHQLGWTPSDNQAQVFGLKVLTLIVYYVNRHTDKERFRMIFAITWTAAGLLSVSFWTALVLTLARLLR